MLRPATKPKGAVMRLGIDLGGTKIEAVVLDDQDQERLRCRVLTPQGDYFATLEAIRCLVQSAEQQFGRATRIGIGIPGSISPANGLVRNANSTCLNGKPLQTDLELSLGRPLRIENDANCLALSEAFDGAGRGAQVVFAVILGTGVGGAITVDGRLLAGHNRIGGEWGHNPLPWPTANELPGPACWCGRRGCIETWLSGPALAASLPGVRDATALVQAAHSGQRPARDALDQWLDRLARSFSAVVNLLDPDIIVLGGGLSQIARLAESIQARWQPWIFADQIRTPIVLAQHGDSSGVRGAARL